MGSEMCIRDSDYADFNHQGTTIAIARPMSVAIWAQAFTDDHLALSTAMVSGQAHTDSLLPTASQKSVEDEPSIKDAFNRLRDSTSEFNMLRHLEESLLELHDVIDELQEVRNDLPKIVLTSTSRFDDDYWLRRGRKREAAVRAIKRSTDYQTTPAGRRPLTPVPNVDLMSKREWEAACIKWRKELRQTAQASTDAKPDECMVSARLH